MRRSGRERRFSRALFLHINPHRRRFQFATSTALHPATVLGHCSTSARYSACPRAFTKSPECTARKLPVNRSGHRQKPRRQGHGKLLLTPTASRKPSSGLSARQSSRARHGPIHQRLATWRTTSAAKRSAVSVPAIGRVQGKQHGEWEQSHTRTSPGSNGRHGATRPDVFWTRWAFV